MMTDSFTMDVASIARARRYVAGALGHCGEEAVDTALLLTSELVTNALVHARTPFDVGVRNHGGVVHVAVTDHGLGTPRLAPVEGTAERGRGLRLLEALAAHWGVDECLPGKTVWFDLHCHRGHAR